MDGGRLHGEERLRQQLVDRATAAPAVPHWLHDGAQDHGCPAPRQRVPFSADGYIRRLEMDWRSFLYQSIRRSCRRKQLGSVPNVSELVSLFTDEIG